MVTLLESSRRIGAVATSESARACPGASLRRLVASSVWTVAGYGSAQALRLAGNVVLAKLLFPEAFGIIVLVNIVVHGLQMFSDVGIGLSVIQNRRGDHPEFLKTAWTIQCFRGGALWLIAIVVAWPIAEFYGEDQLLWLIPVAGLGALFEGFNSRVLFTLTRRLELGKLTTIEVTAQALGVLVAIIWALVSPSVWALVAAPVSAALIKMALSHIVLPRVGHSFYWDRRAAGELVRFGRWIFISTALGFLVARGDQMILGRLFTRAELGTYFIALMLSQVVIQILQRLSAKVLLADFARLAESGVERLRRRVISTRAICMVLSLPPLWVLTVCGPEVVQLLFDDRYRDAGWILQILAAGAVVSAVSTTAHAVLLPLGDSFGFMVCLAGRAGFLLAAMAIGSWLAGTDGLIVGVAASALLNYPLLAWRIARHGLWLPALDVIGLGASACAIGLGLWLAR